MTEVDQPTLEDFNSESSQIPVQRELNATEVFVEEQGVDAVEVDETDAEEVENVDEDAAENSAVEEEIQDSSAEDVRESSTEGSNETLNHPPEDVADGEALPISQPPQSAPAAEQRMRYKHVQSSSSESEEEPERKPSTDIEALKRQHSAEIKSRVKAEYDRVMNHSGRVKTANLAMFGSSLVVFSAALGLFAYTILRLRRCAVIS